ncbi:hypothetical protein VitviT2T_028329 [Vitis vinifera]|uniref:RecA family profile 1 domain-containing protein n=1 Tax=Vitis vinifera TaxID=29760 RepID=A0ABY9DSQ5_VITVI|nr:hypothetical protein VitviT2T_028329 [Vitis vinifera]
MANKWISEMSLPTSIANIFVARNITTAKEALSLTEFELMELLDVVGWPSLGIGKTQFCLKLSLLASLLASYGGLDGRVIYIDVDSKFSSRNMIEIGLKSSQEILHMEGMAK